MSKLLAATRRSDELSAARRRRIEEALAVLSAQPFVPSPPPDGAAPALVRLPLHRLRRAAIAYRERLPMLAGR